MKTSPSQSIPSCDNQGSNLELGMTEFVVKREISFIFGIQACGKVRKVFLNIILILILKRFFILSLVLVTVNFSILLELLSVAVRENGRTIILMAINYSCFCVLKIFYYGNLSQMVKGEGLGLGWPQKQL